MLAAAPQTESKVLHLFCLALCLASRGENIPQGLKDYFDSIVSQARILARDASAVKEQIMPGAIQLALEMRRHKDFSSAMDNISDVNMVTPEVANKIMADVERSFVRHG